MKKLTISKSLKLPIEAATESFAIVGRRGAGKTNTGVVMAEEMLELGIQIVVLEPVDCWWGLRVSADGKSAGYPIYVAGGSHEDIPLTPESGPVLADVVVDHGVSMILSVRHLSKKNQRRFVGEFCDRLYDRKADPKLRTLLHVFIDEADSFVPQRLVPGSEQCFGAVDTLVRRGRSSGLAPTLISQRPQVINKDVLSQTEVLVSHQLTGPQDRKALLGWIEANDPDNSRAQFMGSLASLERGTAWFWSPGLLGVFKKVPVRARRTFDSSSTPKPGAAVAKPRAFAPVDLEKLTSDIASTIEKAKAADPKKLQRRIRELERELTAAGNKARPLDPVAEERILKSAVRQARRHWADEKRRLERQVAQLAGKLQKIVKMAGGEGGPVLPEPPARSEAAHTKSRQPAPPRPRPRPAQESPGGNGDLTGPERRILNAIAWMESIGVDTPEQVAVAFLAGYKFGGGAYNNPRGSLRVKGLIEYAGKCVRLTDDGRAIAEAPEAPLTTHDLHEAVMDRLPGPETKVLQVALNHYPEVLSNEQCATEAGYSPNGGAYNNPRGRLRTLGLIEYPEKGHVRARDILFLDG